MKNYRRLEFNKRQMIVKFKFVANKRIRDITE